MNAPCLIFAVILLVPGQSAAQEASGSIQGEVRDLNGTPVAEASVYAIDYHNIRRRVSARADSNGRFVLRNLIPTTYSVHAYKESEGYPDTFFSFFDVGNKKAHQLVQVPAGGMTKVLLELGPKYALLKLSVKDEDGTPVSVGLAFMKGDDQKPIYRTSVKPNGEVLVPPVPFRFVIEADGLQSWQSDWLNPRPGEVVPIAVHLKGHASIGTMHVMVIDSKGARVPEASVYVVESSNVGQRIEATADSKGSFVFRDLPPGSYTVHAYTESGGYPDTFVPFFRIGERKRREIRLRLHGTAGVTVRLGPKYPILELSIQDEQGKPVAADATLARTDDRGYPYHVPVTANARLLVPPVPFSFELKAAGFESWHSELISLHSGETHSLTVHLKAIR